MVKRILCALCGLFIALSACGCSGSSEPSSGQPAESQASDTASQESSASADESSQAFQTPHFTPTRSVGEKLKAVYDIYQSGKYTLECRLTGTNIKDEIQVIRVVDGEDVYQLQNEPLGSHGSITLSGKSYDFDYVCGMYRESTDEPELNIIESIIENGVPRTESPSAPNAEYDTEQYTYTGDTYITVMDFYFDKQDGHLVKYTMTYSVEGRDDVVEERVITRLDNEIDDSVFNAYFTDTLVNFDSMSEEQRLGFCQGLCATYGITADDMSELGVSTENLGTIDFDTLFTLVHTYGKNRSHPDVSSESSSNDSSEASSEAEEAISSDQSSEPESSTETDTSAESEEE